MSIENSHRLSCYSFAILGSFLGPSSCISFCEFISRLTDEIRVHFACQVQPSTKFEAFQARMRLSVELSPRPCHELFVHLSTQLNLLHLYPANIHLTPSPFCDLIHHTKYTRSVCFTQPELPTPSLTQNSELQDQDSSKQVYFDDDSQNNFIHIVSGESGVADHLAFLSANKLELMPSRVAITTQHMAQNAGPNPIPLSAD